MKKITLLLFVALSIIACSNCSKKDGNSSGSGNNHLSFKIDGVYWEADKASVFGSYHFTEALGPKLINISGDKGSGATQQSFIINLYNTDKEGTYTVNVPNNGNATTNQNITQFALLTETNYLCGGANQGGQLTINITKVSQNPQIVEATFSGTMQCVEGNIISITEGKFIYHE